MIRPRRDEVVGAAQRRMAWLALLTSALLVGLTLLGAGDALAYLGPTFGLLVLLVLGRYPAERVFERRLPHSKPAERTHRVRRPLRASGRALLPRGGVLLAAGLAGRAPPPLAD